MDEMAQFMDEHFYGVEQTVLTAHRENSTQVCLSYSSFYCRQAHSCKKKNFSVIRNKKSVPASDISSLIFKMSLSIIQKKLVTVKRF